MRITVHRSYLFLLVLLSGLFACQGPPVSEEEALAAPLPAYEAISLFGDTLSLPAPSEATQNKAALAAAVYEANPDDVEALIWHGRWTAYVGHYRQAIAVFTDGIERFPDDARMYRHRGHRYLSIRAFELAEIDFKRAWELSKGKPDQIEPDGMPNPQYIPVSTLQSNILYHLGLSLYLQNKLEEAVPYYREDIARKGNNDQVVSTVHWLYMSLRLLDRDEEAAEALQSIRADMPVVENENYLKLCLFYKGEITEDQLLSSPDSGSAGDAVLYGLANWYFYNGQTERAKEFFEGLIMGPQWNSFGHIAAEAQYVQANTDFSD